MIVKKSQGNIKIIRAQTTSVLEKVHSKCIMVVWVKFKNYKDDDWFGFHFWLLISGLIWKKKKKLHSSIERPNKST